MNKTSYAKIITTAVLFIGIAFFSENISVFAEGGGTGTGGGGGDTEAVDGCKDGKYYNSRICSDESVGGASWHIFKTTNSISWNYLFKGVGQPVYDTSVAPMKKDNYDRQLAQKCNPRIFQYYFAFVYDGWHGRDKNNNMENKPTYWGPVSIDVYIENNGKQYKPSYNKFDTHDGADLRAGFENGIDMHTWRVGKHKATGAILTQYNLYLKAVGLPPVTAIPDKVAYFCYSDVKHALTAYAKHSEGANGFLNNGNAVDRDIVYSGENATVDTSTVHFKGYTWKHWGSVGACKHAGENRACTVNNLTEDTDVNAYYTRNSFKGRAYVSGGGVSVNTGFVAKNKTESVSMDSSNDGNKVSFGVDLKTIAGSGRTDFSTNTSYLKIPPFAPSTEGTKVGETTDKVVKPGQSECKHITFKPFGDYSNYDYVTAKTCISAKVTTFKARSTVSGGTSGTNTENGTTKYFFIDNCSPTTGCKVKFKHEMSSAGSHGSSDWQVSRTSNADKLKDNKAIVGDKELGKGTFKYNTNWTTVQGPSEELTLYPGVVVCERITYKPSNDATETVDKTYTEVCASALGKGQPDDPPGNDDPEDPGSGTGNFTGNGAFINIKVCNESLGTKCYREVYAKPGDHLKYRTAYNPVLQYTYYLKPQQMQIVGTGANGTTITNTNKATLGTLFNDNRGNNLSDWNNAFSIQRIQGSNSSTRGNYGNRRQSGVTKIVNDKTDSHTVSQNNVGTSIIDKIVTNLNNSTTTTPQQVTFVKNGNNNLGKVDVNKKEVSAYARIPYNFTTETKILDDSSTIGAGESKSIKINISLNPKKNSLTTKNNEKYVTKADDVLRKLIVYVPNSPTPKAGGEMPGDRNSDICSGYFGLSNSETTCGYSDSVTEDIVPSGTGNVTSPISKEQSFNFYAQDMPAGSKVCVASAVYPSSSGADSNYNDTNYNRRWAISQSKCFTVVKKPALQAWGGNIFTQTGIAGKRSIKRHLDQKNTYSIKSGSSNDGNSYIYGSWSELGVISGGPVIDFASGAATGYYRNNGGVNGLIPKVSYAGSGSNPRNYNGMGNNQSFKSTPGGLITTSGKDFKYSSRLTIPNNSLGAGVNNSNSSIASQVDDDKNTVISKLIPDIENDYGSDSIVEGLLDGKDRYSAESVTINAAWASEPGMRVIHGKNINIRGNITYNDSKTYKDLKEIPKIIIYAEESINIDCSVWRIDALLIADKRVITCSNGYENLSDNSAITNKINSEISRPENSNQLIVNGAIITEKLYANRTYGAATGANSIIPAELINFDPTLYDFGKDSNDNDDDSYGNLEVNYIRELSPRK